MKTLALGLFKLATIFSPAERSEWLNGMRAELEFVPLRQQSRYAAGCLVAVFVWRLWTPHGIRSISQAVLLAANSALALLAATYALRGSIEDLTPLMAALAVYYGGAVAVTAWKGLRGAAVWTAGGLALNSLFLATWAAAMIQPSASAYMRALSIEVYVILATFLTVAVAAQTLAPRLERGP